MKKLILLLIVLSWNAWSDGSERQRTYPAKYDPNTQTYSPPRIPSADLVDGQRYRAIILQRNADGSIQTERFMDFTYNGPSHPPGFVNPVLNATEVFESPQLPPTKIYAASADGTPYVVNEQPWVTGYGLDKTRDLCMTSPGKYGACGNNNGGNGNSGDVYGDSKSAEFGIVVPPWAPPPEPSAPKSENPKPSPKPESPSTLGPDLKRAGQELGKNIVLNAMRAFQETPEDRRQREEFEKRQAEIYKRQQELETELYNKKVDSAVSVARALTLFQDSSSARPSVSDVQSRIDHARQYGNPSYGKLLNHPTAPAPADLTQFIGEYGKQAKDFLTTRYKLAEAAETVYIFTHDGYDFEGKPVSSGKMLGLALNLVDTGVEDSVKVYAFAKGVEKGAPLAAQALIRAAPLLAIAAPAVAAVSVALYSQELRDGKTSYIQDPSLRNAANIFCNGHELDNDNLAMSALGEKFAAWGDPSIKFEETAKAKEVYDFIGDWLQRNRNEPRTKLIDVQFANMMHDKLQNALELKLPEPHK